MRRVRRPPPHGREAPRALLTHPPWSPRPRSGRRGLSARPVEARRGEAAARRSLTRLRLAADAQGREDGRSVPSRSSSMERGRLPESTGVRVRSGRTAAVVVDVVVVVIVVGRGPTAAAAVVLTRRASSPRCSPDPIQAACPAFSGVRALVATGGRGRRSSSSRGACERIRVASSTSRARPARRPRCLPSPLLALRTAGARFFLRGRVRDRATTGGVAQPSGFPPARARGRAGRARRGAAAASAGGDRPLGTCLFPHSQCTAATGIVVGL